MKENKWGIRVIFLRKQKYDPIALANVCLHNFSDKNIDSKDFHRVVHKTGRTIYTFHYWNYSFYAGKNIFREKKVTGLSLGFCICFGIQFIVDIQNNLHEKKKSTSNRLIRSPPNLCTCEKNYRDAIANFPSIFLLLLDCWRPP